MSLLLQRKNIFFKPDSKRVLARYFNLSNERREKIILRVLNMDKQLQEDTLNQLLRNFSRRHRSVIAVWEKNFKRATENLVLRSGRPNYSQKEKLLLGAYFTLEYSVEAAAFFNPSIVESPDQTQLRKGQKRIILSFRATGEGHVSSIVFRSGVIDENWDIELDEVGTLLEKPETIKNHEYNKEDFLQKLQQIDVNNSLFDTANQYLADTFTYEELRQFIRKMQQQTLSVDEGIFLNHMLWLASSHYEMRYSLDTSISERVIFPISDTEKNGIEDARFLQFRNDKGKSIYYATYTAYDGISIMPKLLSTKDFVSFKVQPINGKIANKGAALFPRKVNGKYAMLCRIDGENNYIAFSDDIINWHTDVILLNEPDLPWEFVQLGNCGSPLETSEGWLVITHGVGPMRQYAIGACLLDLHDPTKARGTDNHVFR